jgi:hypothetical protein
MPSPTIRLDVASPVLADIDIANSVEPLPIADCRHRCGARVPARPLRLLRQIQGQDMFLHFSWVSSHLSAELLNCCMI